VRGPLTELAAASGEGLPELQQAGKESEEGINQPF